MSVMFDRSRRSERHNLVLNTIEGALFVSGSAFISPQTVLPALVVRLGGSNVAVGAITVVLYFALFLPQLFAARYVETLPWKKPWAVRVGGLQRIINLLIGLSVLLFGARTPHVALACFFGFFILNQVLAGIATPGWFDLFAKLTPLKKRGRLSGFRSSLGGIGAFLCGLVLTSLLFYVSFPANYAIAFFLAFILQGSSVLVQMKLIEEAPSRTVPKRPMFDFLRQLPVVLGGNKEFRNFMIACALLIIGSMPAGFFVVHALRQFKADEAIVGQFTLSMVAVQVVSALVTGVITDRYGNKIVLTGAAVAMLCATTAAIVVPTAGWFMLVFLLLGINIGAELMARHNLAIEYGPPEKRSTYIGLMNTALAPFYLSSLLGGFLSDAFGYHAMFGVGIVFSLAGILFLAFHVQEPRLLQVPSSGGSPGEIRSGAAGRNHRPAGIPP